MTLDALAQEFYNLFTRIDRGDRAARHEIDKKRKRNGGGDIAFQAAVEAWVVEFKRLPVNYDEHKATFAAALKRKGLAPSPTPVETTESAPSEDGGGSGAPVGAASPTSSLPTEAMQALSQGSNNHPFGKLATAWAGMGPRERDYEVARAVDSLGVILGRENLARVLDAWLVKHFPAPPEVEAEADLVPAEAPPAVPAVVEPKLLTAAQKKAKAEADAKAKVEAEAKAKAEAEAASKEG